MSLRDLGVFNPLPPDHKMIGEDCQICKKTLAKGDRVALMPIQTIEEANSIEVEAKAICANCALIGRTVRVPDLPYARKIKNITANGYIEMYDGTLWPEEDVHPDLT